MCTADTHPSNILATQKSLTYFLLLGLIFKIVIVYLNTTIVHLLNSLSNKQTKTTDLVKFFSYLIAIYYP